MKAIYQVDISQDFDWKDVESRIAGEKFIQTTKIFGIPFSRKEMIVAHDGIIGNSTSTSKVMGFGNSQDR
jgi:hypothetical protein